MQYIAHRGFADVEPENTIRALSAAADVADAVEFDVRRCGSGEVVVIHDATVDRVTDGTGVVADLSLAEIRELTVLKSGERIPTLEEALDALPPTVEISCELKEVGIVEDVLAAIEVADLPNRVLCTSFRVDALRAIGERDPAQEIGLLVNRELDRPVTTAVELGCTMIGARSWRCLFTRLPDRASAVDLEIHSWKVPNRFVARALEWRGVDAASVDRPMER